MKVRLVVGILNSEKTLERREAVRKTWLKRLSAEPGIQALFLVGRPGLSAEISGDVLYLNCPDAYEYLPLKTRAFLEFAESSFDYEYVFKCDDDTYVHPRRLAAYDCRGEDYIGFVYWKEGRVDPLWHMGKVHDLSFKKPYEGKVIGPWAEGGPGYFLSRRAVRKILETLNQEGPEAELYEDKMVGDCLTRSGISCVHDSAFLNRNHAFARGDGKDRVSLHPVKVPEMEYFDRMENGEPQ